MRPGLMFADAPVLTLLLSGGVVVLTGLCHLIITLTGVRRTERTIFTRRRGGLIRCLRGDIPLIVGVLLSLLLLAVAGSGRWLLAGTGHREVGLFFQAGAMLPAIWMLMNSLRHTYGAPLLKLLLSVVPGTLLLWVVWLLFEGIVG